MKKKYVYIVQDKRNLVIYGCFDTEQKAEKYSNNSVNAIVRKLEVI